MADNSTPWVTMMAGVAVKHLQPVVVAVALLKKMIGIKKCRLKSVAIWIRLLSLTFVYAFCLATELDLVGSVT